MATAGDLEAADGSAALPAGADGRILLPALVLAWAYILTTAAAFLIWDDGSRDLLFFGYDALGAYAAVAMLPLLGMLWAQVRQGRSILRIDTWRGLRAPGRGAFTVRWLLGCTLIWPFLDVFTWAKTRIPHVNPFTWDALFTDLERTLHFGTFPWQWSLLLVPSGEAVRILELIYHPLFFTIVFAFILFQSTIARPGPRALQTVLTYILVWVVLGNVAAMVFSSAGPCFFHLVEPEAANPFAPLMADLTALHASHGVAAVARQRILWAGYEGTLPPFGISAMPSVHIGIAALLLISGLRANRWAGALGVCFFLLMLVGSVRLGWHYAIDGYLAVVLVAGIWWATGRFARWYAARSTFLQPAPQLDEAGPAPR